MKAITTRYIGQTDRRPARIIASDSDGNRFVVAVDSEEADYPHDNAHRRAAVCLCKKMQWPGAETLIEGSIKHGRVFVFPPTPDPYAGWTMAAVGCHWTRGQYAISTQQGGSEPSGYVLYRSGAGQISDRFPTFADAAAVADALAKGDQA
jgi:hypothetical protein